VPEIMIGLPDPSMPVMMPTWPPPAPTHHGDGADLRPGDRVP